MHFSTVVSRFESHFWIFKSNFYFIFIYKFFSFNFFLLFASLSKFYYNNKTKRSGSFQLSPDFRQRASSNASSVGRLSPIPALVGIDSDWPYGTNLEYSQDLTDSGTAAGQTSQQGQAALDELAGSLAGDLTLQNEFLQGSVYVLKISAYTTIKLTANKKIIPKIY